MCATGKLNIFQVVPIYQTYYNYYFFQKQSIRNVQHFAQYSEVLFKSADFPPTQTKDVTIAMAEGRFEDAVNLRGK